MTTYRVNKQGKTAPAFTRVLNELLQDTRLSFKARGLLAYMLSKPDNFKFHIDELIKHATDGKDSIRAGMKELEKWGYLNRYSIKEKGKIVSWVLDVYEKPESGFPQLENPTLITNVKEITNDKDLKDYLFLSAEDRYSQIYNTLYHKKFGKDHPKVTMKQMEQIREGIADLHEIGVTEEDYTEAVEKHLENLPRKNDGKIFPFLKAYMRHFVL
ncbi:hypothetical protein MKY42_11625 [Paenibacillus sp. FSL W7-1088]|uniref:hypothetical protein n=1 Tax=Paenibacillus sp. FSL W7-1088 TaxID=2921695 RepID=UPI0030EC3037